MRSHMNEQQLLWKSERCVTFFIHNCGWMRNGNFFVRRNNICFLNNNKTRLLAEKKDQLCMKKNPLVYYLFNEVMPCFLFPSHKHIIVYLIVRSLDKYKTVMINLLVWSYDWLHWYHCSWCHYKRACDFEKLQSLPNIMFPWLHGYTYDLYHWSISPWSSCFAIVLLSRELVYDHAHFKISKTPRF